VTFEDLWKMVQPYGPGAPAPRAVRRIHLSRSIYDQARQAAIRSGGSAPHVGVPQTIFGVPITVEESFPPGTWKLIGRDGSVLKQSDPPPPDGGNGEAVTWAEILSGDVVLLDGVAMEVTRFRDQFAVRPAVFVELGPTGVTEGWSAPVRVDQSLPIIRLKRSTESVAFALLRFAGLGPTVIE
jgi:hypothetical protein